MFNEGALERIDGGFTVPVTVESYGDQGDGYIWTPTLSVVRDGVSAVLDPDTRLVTVTGLDDGESAVLTMTVTRTGYDTDDATVSGAALDAARTVAFDASTATETGFTTRCRTWTRTLRLRASPATTPDGAQADADQIVTDTGLVTVTDVDPGTAA